MPKQISHVDLWINGPNFLLLPENNWPAQPECLTALNNAELKRSISCVASRLIADPVMKIIDHYFSLNRLLRVVACFLRVRAYLMTKCAKHLQHKPAFDVSVVFTAKELDNALLELVKYVQMHAFSDAFDVLPVFSHFVSNPKLLTEKRLCRSPSLNALSKLNPVNVNGILYMGGRLKYSLLPEGQKHQMILPSEGNLTQLIVQFYHDREGHCGTVHVLSSIRERFWILKGQATMRKVPKDCRQCRFWKSRPGCQMMAPLHLSRITPGNPPFQNVGVDYMGPLSVKMGRHQVKRYACVFVCMATHAVHIEMAYSLETDSFLNVFQRFCSRRGRPTIVFGDNGTNFTGAEKEYCVSVWNNGINLRYMIRCVRVLNGNSHPLGASHQGGVWERVVRSVRKIMGSLVGESSLDDDTLCTLLAEIERILNYRPLTLISDDVHNLATLTPNMILLGRVKLLTPDQLLKADGYLRSWLLVHVLVSRFWERWIKEYIPTLQIRQKWLTPERNLQVGDLVLLVNENTKRGNWPKGLIIECLPHKYGSVRRVKVKTASNVYVRDICKLCLLEAVE